jgi:uncharacterized membrane protein YeaQ/YmgE (transglycosylase-associated protein family)
VISALEHHLALQALVGVIAGRIVSEFMNAHQGIRDLAYMFVGATGGAAGGQLISRLLPDLLAEHMHDLDQWLAAVLGGITRGAISVILAIKIARLSRPQLTS